MNVLLALLDADHTEHERARDWISAEIAHGWASCAITQNDFVRVLTQPRYPSPISPAQAIDLLARATGTGTSSGPAPSACSTSGRWTAPGSTVTVR